jgi:glycosyltransferase involved in cell wall biosynthesis
MPVACSPRGTQDGVGSPAQDRRIGLGDAVEHEDGGALRTAPHAVHDPLVPVRPARARTPEPGLGPLRIAVLGTRGVPATFGGVERHVEEIGARLASRGHDVTVFCRANYGDTAPSRYRGMRLRWLPSVSSQSLDASVHSALAAIVALGGRYDIVHYHNAGPALASPLTRALSRSRVVVTLHSLNSEHEKWGRLARTVLARAERMSVHLPDRTVVVSETWRRTVADRYGRPTTVVGNGVARPTLRPPGPVLADLGLDPQQYVLFVGRLSPEKGPDLLLEAYRAVAGDRRLVVVGGSSFNDEYVADLQRRGLDDPRVVFAGFRNGAELEELYSNAGLVVVPSRSEGQPLVVLEALAYGVPTIATAIPGIAEIVGDTGAAVDLVPAEDPEALGAAIRSRLSAAGIGAPRTEPVTEILDRYSWDAVTDSIESVYAAALATPRRRRASSPQTG